MGIDRLVYKKFTFLAGANDATPNLKSIERQDNPNALDDDKNRFPGRKIRDAQLGTE